MGPEANIDACQAAHRGDTAPLRALLDTLIGNLSAASDVDIPDPRRAGSDHAQAQDHSPEPDH